MVNISSTVTFYSDDERKSWKRSPSELFVSIDQGRQGAYSFEELWVGELKDGRVLMFARNWDSFTKACRKTACISWLPAKPVALFNS